MSLHRALMIFAATVVGPAACAHHEEAVPIAVEPPVAPPPALATFFARHPVWLSVASRVHHPGVFPPGEVSLVRRWELMDGERGPMLVEIDSSSLADLVERSHRGELEPRVVHLDRKPFMNDFFARGEALPEDQVATFARLDSKRFELVMDDGGARVTFLPAPNDYAADAAQIPDSKEEFGMWTTPFGPESEIYGYVRRRLGADAVLPVADGRFLHHDLHGGRRIAVRIDPSFPAAYRDAVGAATAAWSKAFPSALFAAPAVAGAGVDPGDCLTGFELCFAWRGEPGLSAIGASAYTQLSFDPYTGLILGGLVTVVNESRQKLAPMPAAEADRFATGALSWDEMAKTVARGGDFEKLAHPRPEALVESMLVHEIGHFNGFAHNFLARADSTPAMPAITVMAYPPFPVAHLMSGLGAQDRARVDLVYGTEKKTAGIEYCSTFDAMTPERGPGGAFRKKAACDVYTLGDAADWYLRLARQPGSTVFADYPDLSNMPPTMVESYRKLNAQKRMPPLNILTHLGFILTDEAAGLPPQDAVKVRTALCGMREQRAEIAAQLRAFHGYELSCPAAHLAE